MRTLYFTIALTIFIAGFGSSAISKTITPPQSSYYAPARFGIPEAVDGYHVLAVMTKENVVCMEPGEKRLVLQSPYLTIESALNHSINCSKSLKYALMDCTE